MSRQRSERAGRRAERVTALLLRLKGFRIVARRFTCPVGEIDLIARRGELLLFVEVKHRSEAGEALEALGRHQQQRITRAALLFLQRRPQLARLAHRFDIIAVVPWRWPLHLHDVWRA